MDQRKNEEYKNKLETERKELLKELGKEEAPEDFGDAAGHSDEETDEAENFGNKVAAAQTLKDRINEIDVALNKIKSNNKYGQCENCGKEIEERVLNASPESRLCKNCKIKK